MAKVFNFYDAMLPLLQALGWHGEPRRIFEAVPHIRDHLSVDSFRNVMANLGYDSKIVQMRLNHVTKPLLPAVFEDDTTVYVAFEDDQGNILVTDCSTNETKNLSEKEWKSGTLYSFSEKQETPPSRDTWLRGILRRFHTYIYWLLGLGFASSILSLATFIFVSVVYDWVVPTQAEGTLIYLVIGLLICLGLIEFLHVVQNKALSYIGARLDVIIGSEVIRQVLSLPISLVEGASVAAQVSRIKQFDSIRDTFTGPIAKLLMEFPFMFIFLIAMGILGGVIVIIPLIMILVFAVVAILLYPSLRLSTSQVSSSVQERRKFLLEGTSHLMTIKSLGAEETWVNRFREVGASVAMAQKRNETLSAFALNVSQSIMKFAGLATIIWGTWRVTKNEMTIGELMTIVLLVWRSLSPLQAAFMILGKADQIVDSINQLNRIMALPTEKRSPTAHIPHFKGHIKFSNVGFRYPNESSPAVQGVIVDVLPGEILAIIGQNGSGKSTIVKLLLGFYYPQAGSISIDGTDIRQFSPISLRQAMCYVPQQNQFFHGTIEQNLRLSSPEASDENMIQAAEMAGLLPDILNLPDGFETQLNDRVMSIFSSGFLQKLNLARAYIRKSSLMILDEPGNTLDHEGDELLKQTLANMKGKRSMVIVTHRPSLIHLADKVLVMHEGAMRMFGPKDKVLEALMGNKS